MVKHYSVLKGICRQILFAACTILFFSNRIAAQCTPIGDPSVYGQNVWNVYGYHGLFTNPGFDTTYSGYFVDTGLSFNSENDFCLGCSPSNAPGYQGCPIATDTMTIIARRQGFPCGLYEIAVTQVPGTGQLAVNGVVVWSGAGVNDGNINAWQGLLDPASQVTLSVLGGTNVGLGTSLDGAINFIPLGNNLITSSGADTFCNGGSVTLSSVNAPAYLWNTGATTQSITVTTAGSYNLTIADTLAGAACMVASNTITVAITAPQISDCPGNIITYAGKGLCGAVVSFDTPTVQDLCSGPYATFGFTGAYQTWTVPAGVTSINVDAGGAAGGAWVPGMVAGYGARVQTTLAVTPGQVLYINVGGAGQALTGGYNGGGNGIAFQFLVNPGGGPEDITVQSNGGGGFTAIGLTGTPLTDTLLIAAGGGGAGMNPDFSNNDLSDYGGNGGGPNGLGGYIYGNLVANEGATQTAPGYGGSFMQGANGQIDLFSSYYYDYNTNASGGGGGGYYGGGSDQGAGGGGGSSYVSPVGTSNTQYTTGGSRTYGGNGYVNISIPYKTVQTAGLPSGTVFPVGTTTVTFAVPGSASTCSFNVTVNPTPVSASATICQGSSYNFNGTMLTQAGLYTDTIPSSSGCDSIINLTLTVNPAPATPTITPAGRTTFCPGSQLKLTASAGSSYQWSTGASTRAIYAQTSGSYIVTVYNASGCGATSAPTVLTVESNPIPTITASGPTTFCQGGSVRLTASAGDLYIWSTGATTRTITARTSDDYFATVGFLPGGCSGSVGQVVTVNQPPVASITASGPTTFCAGGSVSLTASAAPAYLWSDNATTQSITVSTTGSYRVALTSAEGCSTSSPVTRVIVRALPNATISATSTELCNGDSIKLTAKPGIIWNWSTGATTRIITVRSAGTYNVTVTNTYNCSGTSAPLPVTDCGSASKTDNSDNDGTNAVTPITLSNTFDVTVYPNPYTGQFHLKVISSGTEDINVKVYDITGKLLEERREMPYGTDVILGNGFAAGVYIIETSQADRVKMTRVVKAE